MTPLELRGTPTQLGRAHGEARRTLIHQHLDLALSRLDTPRPRAAAYAAVVEQWAPNLVREVEGVAEGAGITAADAWILQLRAELRREGGCSSFAALGRATADGTPLLAQTLDLPAPYRPLMGVLLLRPSDGPACLMLSPAGQIGHVGMNEAGVALGANYLACDGWRVGFPRYLLTRCILACRSIAKAREVIAPLPRAASRNLLLVDLTEAIDLELTPRAEAALHPSEGVLTHTNHYLSPALQGEDRLEEPGRSGSHARLKRLDALLTTLRGTLDEAAAWRVLADPAISRRPRPPRDVMTVAAFVARPTTGRLEVTLGPPDATHPARYVL